MAEPQFARMSECQKVRDEGICSWYAMRMTIIAIANQKGGTAKTTSTAAIGVHLSRMGVPTHLIDMDPQADLSAAFGITDDSNRLLSSLECADALPIVRVSENLTLSPSSLQLLRCETEFLSRPSREFVLRSAIERTELPNDAIVLVDCPPSLGVLSIASLVAAQGLCVVVQPGGFELQTLLHLGMTVDSLRKYVNPELTNLGAIVTNAHRRRLITQQVVDELATRYRILGTVRSDAKVVYATTAGRIHLLTKSSAMDDYREPSLRLLERLRDD